MNPNLAEKTHGHNGIIKYPNLHKLLHSLKRQLRPTVGKAETPYDWTNPIPIPTLVVKNQFQAGSCGGEATSYGSEVLTGIPASAKSVYSRGFAPGGGMTLSSVEAIVQEGINIETDVPDYIDGTTTEAFMEDTTWETPELLAKGQINALGAPINVNIDVESIAEAIRDYKFVIFLLQGQNNGTWYSYIPAPPSSSNPNPIWGHYMCGVSANIVDGAQGVVCYQSWGLEVGASGVQFLNETYINSGSIVDCIAFQPKATEPTVVEEKESIISKIISLLEDEIKAIEGVPTTT